MTINSEQIQALKAAAIAVGRDGRTDDEWFHYLQCVHYKFILSLLAERDADKALIAELEARTLTVNLRKHSVDEVMIISQMDREYSEGWCSANDWAIQMVREACAAAGITLVVGE